MFQVLSGLLYRGAQSRPSGPVGLLRRAGGALAIILLGSVTPAFSQEPDSIVPIINEAEATYVGPDGKLVRARDLAQVRLLLRPGLNVSPVGGAGGELLLCGGEVYTLAYTLQNTGNSRDEITLSPILPEGIEGSLFLAHGEDPEDLEEIDGPIPLAAGEEVTIHLEIEVGSELKGVGLEVGFAAQSSVDPRVIAEGKSSLQVCGPPPELGLSQLADQEWVTVGDTIEYTFVVENLGETRSLAPVFIDTLPSGLRLIGGTLTLDSEVLPPGDPRAYLSRLGDGREFLELPLDTIEVGGEHTIGFRALVLTDSTVSKLENVGRVIESRGGENGSGRVSVSNPTSVDVRLPDVALGLRVVGRTIIYPGDEIVFELTYRNASDMPVPNAVLTNTLPLELVFLDSDPSPIRRSDDSSGGSAGGQVIDNGGAWVEWELGTLEPGEEGQLYLRTHLPERYELLAEEIPQLVNHATLSAGGPDNRVAVAASVSPMALNNSSGAVLALEKSVGRLEVGLGEPVPYALLVENAGSLLLHDLVIRDSLPEDLELEVESVVGADSVEIAGSELRLYFDAPVAPGTVRQVRYNAVAVGAPGKAVGSHAVAEAEFGRVQSDTVDTWVRVRKGPSLPARTLIGKVWVDHDGNGRQDPGDEGLAGVDIWTSDGQIVRTDAQGRFSLQDLEPGRYTLRIDMTGLEDRYEVAGRGSSREIREVHLDGWTMGQAEFRLIPKQVAVDYHGTPPVELLFEPEETGGNGETDLLSSDGLNGSSGEGIGGLGIDFGESVEIEPARSAEEREAARRSALIAGPGVEFVSPIDGSVLGSSKIYVGVEGEAGQPVELLRGGEVLQSGTIRPDGVHDFIAVGLEEGLNLLEVRMKNSWGNERSDTIAVHRSGRPAKFEVLHTLDIIRAESPTADTILVRLLDEWGVPVVNSPGVSVHFTGVRVEGEGGSGRSVRLQPDEAGWLKVVVRGGDEVGRGLIALTAGDAEFRQPLQVLAPVRPLIATMSGRLGFGATEDGNYASITARGALDEITSLTLSFDSRRGEEGSAFRRSYDPLDESLYPTIGDRSERRVLAGETELFSAKIERGLDWVAFGDIRTEGFSGSGELTKYDRAFSGVASRLSAGPLTFHGFGSMTSQFLEEVQVRGEGSSGPYRLGGRVRPGTDRIAIEVRARENAARVLSRTELVRYSDYQIDYESGDILLSRFLPSTDTHGNPVYLVAVVERLNADERHWVGGLRVEFDATETLGAAPGDSVGIALFGVRDGADETLASPGLSGSDLMGGEFFARFGKSNVGAEILQASSDSSGLAGRLSVDWEAIPDRSRLRAEWLNIGSGFSQRQNPRLRAGLQEIRLGGDLKLSESFDLYLEHDRQNFRDFNTERDHSRARVAHTRGEQNYSLESGLLRETRDGISRGNTLLTRATATLSPAVSLWAENRHQLSDVDEGGLGYESHGQLGAGMSLRFLERFRLDGQYRRIGAEDPFTVTSLTLNIDSWKGGRVWGGLEGAGGSRQGAGVNLGWNQEIDLVAGWSLSSQLERRFGLDGVDVSDPIRALPFPQDERNRTSGGLGLTWRGRGGDTFTARGEMIDGEITSGYRIESVGDISLGDDLALLMRHDWLKQERTRGSFVGEERREQSLLGLAFRPTSSNTLNALAKVEWRRTLRPDDYRDPFLAGDNARLIGSTDLAWLPGGDTEMLFRYAIRGGTYSNLTFGDQEVRSTAHFFGARTERPLFGRVSGRLDGRFMSTKSNEISRWSLAPSLVMDLSELEVEVGYRFGDLKDIDFGGRGGLGFFVSVGLRMTEKGASRIADFWVRR